MDWDLKMPSWDLPDIPQEAVIPSSVPAPISSSSGPSIDLKLGRLGDFRTDDHTNRGEQQQQPKIAMPTAPAVSTSTSLKRPRNISNAVGTPQCPNCAVDGCKADLSKCRDYHRRHKVCEAHSKTPVVTVAGREMRFCQQCSRFHNLTEFDEAKRSCRKRLDGHNRRRRKPQPDPMNSGSFITNQPGTRFLSYPTPRPEPSWSAIIKSEESPFYSHQMPLHFNSRPNFVGTASIYPKEGRRFPFLHDGDHMNFSTSVTLQASVCQPLLKTIAPPESSSSNKIFADGGLTQVLDSDCALSLLSLPAHSSAIDLSRVVQSNEQASMAQPLVPNMQFSNSSWFARAQASSGVSATGFSCPTIGNEHLNNVLVPSSNDHEIAYQGIFHVGGEGSSEGTSPSLHFSWQ